MISFVQFCLWCSTLVDYNKVFNFLFDLIAIFYLFLFLTQSMKLNYLRRQNRTSILVANPSITNYLKKGISWSRNYQKKITNPSSFFKKSTCSHPSKIKLSNILAKLKMAKRHKFGGNGCLVSNLIIRARRYRWSFRCCIGNHLWIWTRFNISVFNIHQKVAAAE